MPAEVLTLEITSPSRAPETFQATQAVLPGAGGVMTVMPGHTPLLTTLSHGALIVNSGSGKRYYAVHGGFAEILDDRILVLADVYETADNIDKARAEAAAERARDRIRKPSDDTDARRAEAALARALARVQAHDRAAY